MSYPYSGVATVNVKDSDKVDYYVCYTGEVTASIDFDEIGIENDPEDEKTVIVEVPEAKIVCNFDSLGSFKFLDVNKGKPLENEIATFTPICKKHMDEQVGKDKTLRKLVQQQASETLQALITPLTEQMNPDYRVVFVDKSQKEAENAAKKEKEQTSSKTEVSKSDKETSNEKK